MRSLHETFQRIYRTNAWASRETRSGGGSELWRTVQIRDFLPPLLFRLGVRSVLDAGCGDWNWQKLINWGDALYTGCDIVPEMVMQLEQEHGSLTRAFFVADLTTDALPRHDAILCRTVLFHLSNEHVLAALRNFAASGSGYLLATTHPHVTDNADITDGDWRRINLCLAPFSLPEPLEMHADAGEDDGYLGVWRLA